MGDGKWAGASDLCVCHLTQISTYVPSLVLGPMVSGPENTTDFALGDQMSVFCCEEIVGM